MVGGVLLPALLVVGAVVIARVPKGPRHSAAVAIITNMNQAIVHRSLSTTLFVLVAVVVACSGNPTAEPNATATQAAAPAETAQAKAPQTPEPTRPAEERIRVVVNKSTEYFTVVGETTSEIFQSIRMRGPQVGSTDALGSVLAQWDLNRLVSSCSIQSLTITLDIVVTLPGRLQTTQDDMRDRWGPFTSGVEKHEQRHVQIYLDGADEMERQMFALDGSCASADAVDRVLGEQRGLIERRQSDFDRDDKREIANRRQPIEARIATNEARRDELERQFNSAEANLSSIKRQLDPTLEAREYNRLVAQYNALLGTRNALANEFNQLQTLIATLIEDFNWTQ